MILGHGNQGVSSALASESLCSGVGQLHQSTVELARRLVRLLPSPLTACFFVNSASEANDLAVTMALAASASNSSSGGGSREEVISIDRAYHGRTAMGIKLGRTSHQLGR